MPVEPSQSTASIPNPTCVTNPPTEEPARTSAATPPTPTDTRYIRPHQRCSARCRVRRRVLCCSAPRASAAAPPSRCATSATGSAARWARTISDRMPGTATIATAYAAMSHPRMRMTGHPSRRRASCGAGSHGRSLPLGLGPLPDGRQEQPADREDAKPRPAPVGEEPLARAPVGGDDARFGGEFGAGRPGGVTLEGPRDLHDARLGEPAELLRGRAA